MRIETGTGNVAEHTTDLSDHRSRLVSLTEEGRRLRAAIIEAALATRPRLDPEDLGRLVTILSKALPPPAESERMRHSRMD
jgi:DNA-binding MarR family transcriptional regulator